MTVFLHDDVLDGGLTVLTEDGNRLDLCSDLPATFTEATVALSLGNKIDPDISAPAARDPDGRQVTVGPFEGAEAGLITASGDAEFWAVTDTVGERLLAAAPLTNPQPVTQDNPFEFEATEIGIPAAIGDGEDGE